MSYLVQDGRVAVEERGIHNVGVADHPAQVRRSKPRLEQEQVHPRYIRVGDRVVHQSG